MNRFSWDVVIPPNTSAIAHIPAEMDSTILEGDHTLDQAQGISVIGRDAKAMICNLEPGMYKFVVKSQKN
jgi:hypothetical protein